MHGLGHKADASRALHLEIVPCSNSLRHQYEHAAIYGTCKFTGMHPAYETPRIGPLPVRPWRKHH